MKVITILSLALFSFTSGVRYEVQDYTCKDNRLRIQYDKNWYDVSLFNVFIHEGYDFCPYLEGDVSFEVEENSMWEEPYPIYLFVDDELLQDTLVEKHVASVKIPSYAYTYTIEEKEEAVIAKETRVKEESMFSKSLKIAFLFIATYLLVWILLYRKNRRYQKDVNHG